MAIIAVRWIAALAAAFLAGKLMSKIKMPAILGWLIAGMILGHNGAALMPEELLSSSWYKGIIMWMQCAFGLMLGTELIWKRLKSYGKALVITTLIQSLGTFFIVSLVFAAVFKISSIPIFLAPVFGGIALATAPAPALSIVNEFHTRGSVTDTLLPMAVLDDVVGIAVFFTVNSFAARQVSGGAVPVYMIPVMIFMPVLIGVFFGIPAGMLLKLSQGRTGILGILTAGITLTVLAGWFLNTRVLTGITLNYMLMGVAFSASYANMVREARLGEINSAFSPILNVSLLAAVADLGTPLNFRLILGAGWYTFIYIAARAFGKYFGARTGAKITGMPVTVRKYLGLTLLPHSGVSLVFTGIVCSVLSPAEPALAEIVQGTIAAAAVLNEIIAVIVAKKGFELAGETDKTNG
ncbi:MAG: cation:proton antiporter [Candidatus Fimisoma sp.]|nr:cation:proton antiporter [Candidatus Fimisoma sp.]